LLEFYFEKEFLEIENRIKLYLDLFYETDPIYLSCSENFSEILNITCYLRNSAPISYFDIPINLSIREGYSNFTVKLENISGSLLLLDTNENGNVDFLQLFFPRIEANTSFNFSVIAFFAINETNVSVNRSFEIRIRHVCRQCKLFISVNKTVDFSLEVFSPISSKFVALIPTSWLIKDSGNATLNTWSQNFKSLEWIVSNFSVLNFSLIPKQPGTYNFSFFFLNDSRIIYSKDYAILVLNQTIKIPTLTYKLNSSVEEGIILEDMENVIFDCNSFSVRGKIGILVKNCENVTIKNCVIKDSEIGILLVNTRNSIIQNNTLKDNTYGIVLYKSNSNLIKENNALENKYGITLYSSKENELRNNKAKTSFNPIEFLFLLHMILSLK